ncbi:hypothetical protein BGZ46_006650 [Entomortierella lignicola]|nr:hypothetical protein BGZ46_006650 [Entomortierella lignicola]
MTLLEPNKTAPSPHARPTPAPPISYAGVASKQATLIEPKRPNVSSATSTNHTRSCQAISILVVNDTTRSINAKNSTKDNNQEALATESAKMEYTTATNQKSKGTLHNPPPIANPTMPDKHIPRNGLHEGQMSNQEQLNENYNPKQPMIRTNYRSGYVAPNNKSLYQDKLRLAQQNKDLIHDLNQENNNLNQENKRLIRRNKDLMQERDVLAQQNSDLKHRENDLESKYNKKVESYKKLEKDYLDLVRPILPTDDDLSTIYRRLTDIRVSIENLVQKARGIRSANLNRNAAVYYFYNSGLLEGFPIAAEKLESYHLDLYMESAVMLTLINHIFYRPLECIFDQSQEFKGIYRWVDARDSKMATRWRQQLCVLVSQDTEMKRKREEEVNRTMAALSSLVSTVYSNVDMSEKIKELCFNAFDLSFAMLGMEYMIYPVPTPLGTPFNQETMVTPQKSNPTGLVSMVIFPSFTDKRDVFKIQPKVWCY